VSFSCSSCKVSLLITLRASLTGLVLVLSALRVLLQVVTDVRVLLSRVVVDHGAVLEGEGVVGAAVTVGGAVVLRAGVDDVKVDVTGVSLGVVGADGKVEEDRGPVLDIKVDVVRVVDVIAVSLGLVAEVGEDDVGAAVGDVKVEVWADGVFRPVVEVEVDVIGVLLVEDGVFRLVVEVEVVVLVVVEGGVAVVKSESLPENLFITSCFLLRLCIYYDSALLTSPYPSQRLLRRTSIFGTATQNVADTGKRWIVSNQET
jgi:hypothetical protein